MEAETEKQRLDRELRINIKAYNQMLIEHKIKNLENAVVNLYKALPWYKKVLYSHYLKF